MLPFFLRFSQEYLPAASHFAIFSFKNAKKKMDEHFLTQVQLYNGSNWLLCSRKKLLQCPDNGNIWKKLMMLLFLCRQIITTTFIKVGAHMTSRSECNWLWHQLAETICKMQHRKNWDMASVIWFLVLKIKKNMYYTLAIMYLTVMHYAI